MHPRTARRPGPTVAAAITLIAALVALPVGVAPASAATQATVSTSCTSATLSGLQSSILKQVNAARTKSGVKALKSYSAMNTVAVNWSAKQAKSAKMSHNPNYSKQIPAGWTAAGENVAYGYDAGKVVAAWLASAGHRKNILSKSFTYIGIGVACKGSTPYYTQVFGGYKSFTPVTPKISGTAKVGKKLTATRGTWTSGVTYSYQWKVGGTAVKGATKSTFVLRKADKGKTVTVTVTGKKKGYVTASKTSKATAKVG